MEPREHLAHLEDEGRRLATAAATGDGSEPVPGCPGWTLGDLVLHTGVVHVWARDALLGGGVPPERGLKKRLAEEAPTSDHSALCEWYAGQVAALLETMRTLAPDTPVWQMWDEPAGPAFWARRQAHETAIHRYDAEGAVGARTAYDATLAADGVDEVLLMVSERVAGFVTDPPVTFAISATDVRREWRLRVDADGRTLTDGGADSDVQVSGSAADLHVFLWNRPPESTPVLSGDAGLWELWRARARIR